MKKIIILLIAGLLFCGSSVIADDVSIDSDGNMTTGDSNTDGNLEVVGASGEDGIVGSATGTGVAGVYGENVTSGNYGILGDDNYGVYGNSSVGTAGYFQGDAHVTGDLTVDGTVINSVNVGISNTTPSVYQDYANDLVIGNNNSNAGLTIHGGTTNYSSIHFAYGTAGSGVNSYRGIVRYHNSTDALQLYATDSVQFYSALTERMRVDSVGNVGIGTSSPGEKLTVAGTIESTSGGVKFPDATVQTSAAYDKAYVDALEARIAALETLLVNFTKVGNDVYITGANLHVRDGSGNTEAVGGKGNLIIGYNIIASNGAHNLVIGKNNNYDSYGGIVVGEDNTISAPYASVSGGQANTASGDYASVSGGRNNTASGDYASVSGGGSINPANGNEAFSHYSSVLGGEANVAGDTSAPRTAGEKATVSGGTFNKAKEFNSSVSGGIGNTASGTYSSVSGGDSNTASGQGASVSGGALNAAVGSTSAVSGGRVRSAPLSDNWAAGGLSQPN